MSDKKCTDRYGVEINPGDLVVTGGEVGIVYAINAHNAPSVKVQFTRDQYACEVGAPEVEKVGKRAKRDSAGRVVYQEERRWEYEYEEYTYMATDRTVVGEVEDTVSRIRQTTYDTVVLRKKDGMMPSRFEKELARHKKIYPDANEA